MYDYKLPVILNKIVIISFIAKTCAKFNTNAMKHVFIHRFLQDNSSSKVLVVKKVTCAQDVRPRLKKKTVYPGIIFFKR